MSSPGAFVISLDFELHWGVFDHTELTDTSRAYFQRTRALIPPTLDLFERHGIRVTWGTVGMLFAHNREELEAVMPQQRPAYENTRYDPYRLLDTVGEDEASDPYHFAPSLIEQIVKTPGQTMASHTFAHYYCLEEGQTLDSFREDLAAAQRINQRQGLQTATSLVFPRNQYRQDYFPALLENGFNIYRGNPMQWFWTIRAGKDTTLRQRAVRLTDNYLPFSGTTSFGEIQADSGVFNVPSSRFFRPYIRKLDGYGGQRLKIRRIRGEMERAARERKNYHLWWHPHNLATHPEKNMAALSEIIEYFSELQNRYGWESHSMESLVRRHTNSAL